MGEARTWAEEEFGHARIGDLRRKRRLVKVARQVAERPGGQITYVFRDSATREGAFRLVENDAVEIRSVALASHEACAGRAKGLEHVFVPIDGSSLNITDDEQKKGTEIVGSRRVEARGFQVMTAIAVAPDGTPLGLCGAKLLVARSAVKKQRRIGGRDRRPVGDKETSRWIEVMNQVREVFPGDKGPRPWFQADRGGDAWPVILDGLEPGQLFTVRATHNRRLKLDSSERSYLWPTLEEQPVLGHHELNLPASGGRRARRATIELRACEVTLDFLVGSKRRDFASMFAVLAQETPETAPPGERIEWLLLTSYPIRTEQDARTVLFGYSQRWRIRRIPPALEVRHACRVEDTSFAIATTSFAGRPSWPP